MKDMEISKELKADIEANQSQLKTAIRNHQNLVLRFKADPDNLDLQKEINKAEEEIILVGLEQKHIVERLREEYRAHQKSVKASVVRNGIEERRFQLSNALSRARKQNMAITRSSSVTSISDDSTENVSGQNIPEQPNPLQPQDLPQADFLAYFFLGTHDVCKEMQNKRAERKRRSTANPHFLYGNKGWDFLPTTSKRKRNAYLASAAISPPHTRQSVKRKQERVSSPPAQTTPPAISTSSNANTEGASIDLKPIFTAFPTIPNLPSGLIIERVSPGSSSPDSKSCVICRQPGEVDKGGRKGPDEGVSGVLSICEACTNGFHVSCHGRTFTTPPRQCPKCYIKEVRTVGSLTVPSGMSVSYVTPSEVSEKMSEKKALEERKEDLAAELTQLQDRHSQLTISLKNQKNHQEQLLMTQQSTEDKIKQILNFINEVKGTGLDIEVRNVGEQPEKKDVKASTSSSSSS